MDLSTILSITTTTILAIIGLCLRTYKIIMTKINLLEAQLARKVEPEEVRDLLDDKLEATRVEFNAMSRRITELRSDQQDLSKKIDKILELCTRFIK